MSETTARGDRSRGRRRGPTPSAPTGEHTPVSSPGGKLGPFYGAGPVVGLGSPVQTKLAVNQPGDAFEQEADSVASRVVAGSSVAPSAISAVSPGALSRATSPEEKKSDERKPPVVQTADQTRPEERKPEQTVVQKADQPKPEEKKPEQKLVQKADERKPEEKRPQPPLVQREGLPRPEEKKPEQPMVQRDDQPKLPERRPDEKAPPIVQKADATEPEESVEEPSVEEPKVIQAAPAWGGQVRAPTGSDGAHGGGAAGTATAAEAADAAIARAGPGRPMNPDTRRILERRLNADLSDVRIHDDDTAREAARNLRARAFTHGRDVWLGRGESDADLALMAHEATHVLQQNGGGGVQTKPIQRLPASATTDAARSVPAGEPRTVQRAQTGGPPTTVAAPAGAAAAPGGSSSPQDAQRKLESFALPPVKSRHRPVYEAWASAGNLKRVKGYDRGDPDQKESVWIPGVTIKSSSLQHIHLDPSLKGKKTLQLPSGARITGTYDELLRQIKVPNWDRRGRTYADPFEVDHIVELQVAGWGQIGAANTIANLELLDKSSNASAGAATRSVIRRKVREYLQATGQPSDKAAVDKYLNENDLTFRRVEAGSGGRSEAASAWWTKTEIEEGVQLRGVQPVKNPGQAGSATSFALLSPGGETVLAEYHHGVNKLTINVTNAADQRHVAGLKITAITLQSNYTSAAPGTPIGTIQASWDLPKGVTAPDGTMAIPILKSSVGQYAGSIGPLPALSADLKGASPLRFDQVSFQGGTLSATGKLTPTIPLLAKVPIDVRMRGRAIEFVYTYRPENLSLPVPGLTIDDSSVSIFFGTGGLGVEGSIDLSVRNLGSGGLTVRVDSQKNFEASGRFSFDKKLFDRAEIEIWYRQQAFGGSGTLAIEKPNKIRGIKSASITATYNAGAFNATGTVAPSIPGVRQASLTVGYSEQEGLAIGGTLQLADNVPGISSGSVEAKVQKRPGEDRWIVSAKGQAVPKIPGISASINVAYDDGAFDVMGTAAYERGMLKGSVTVGVTNRPIGPDGRPGGPPAAHSDRLTAYGGGTVTIRIAPWLQGTIGIMLQPNGEMVVSGEVGLPAAVDIFPEKALNKNIFQLSLDIPIIGVAAAGHRIGIFASVTGGLDLSAGIGPAQLQQLRLKVTYNPDHEEQTTVVGDATLHVPAHAGLRLFVRGGIGAGIPIVDAQAGLEVGGALGLEGALDAGVHVDWMPTRGLQLDAEGSVFVEPKLKFDINAFVLVELDLLLKTITLYDKRWQLAGVEYGSGLRFGVTFPIHYREGQPFELSLSDVQFQIPDINPNQLLPDLIKKIV